MQYKHIFFDLDGTLWDFETNSKECLFEIFEQFNLSENGIESFHQFHTDYLIINDHMWSQYGKGLIDKHTLRYDRFHQAFSLHGINNIQLSTDFANQYVSLAPFKNGLFPHTLEVLNYLQNKYSLHIITNGFEEVQHIKLKHSNLEKYFTHIITSEKAGYKKPDARIFEFALKCANATAESSLMIGDKLEADIDGAKNSGIDQIFFNPKKEVHNAKPTYEINFLSELLMIL